MVTIDGSVMDVIQGEAPKFASECKETGGYLFGYSRADGDVRFLHAIGPGPYAEREWALFNADHNFYKAERKRLRATDEFLDVIGAWHTHPTGYPHSSPADDEAAFWTLDNWNVPVWYEFIVVVADDGTIARVRHYRYSRENGKEEVCLS